MGQAFDRDGHVLGEAYGDTKREVLEKLEMMHPTAEEIRIKTMHAEVKAAVADKDTSTRPADRLEQFFVFAHLPPHLQAISKPFSELAAHIIATLPSNPERTVALRKLLEAKDCAVRALLFK